MKTVLMTGATGTIGKATAMELAGKDCRLILLGRNAGKLTEARSGIANKTGNQNIDIFLADLSEPLSIKLAVKDITKKYASLDVLINIAAIFKPERTLNSVGREIMLATNHLGPFLLTNELLGLLKKGKPSRIITVTAPSTTKIKFDDINGDKNFSAGFLGMFGATKMMNLMFGYTLARRLNGSEVTSNVFHPGLVKSGLTDDMPAIMDFIIKRLSGGPEKAARMLTRLALDEQFKNTTGKFIRNDGKELSSSKYSLDTGIQDRLWSVSEQLVQ